MCHNLVAAHRLSRMCHTTRQERVCQYTGCPHITLRGRDPQGTPWTKRAQDYSPGFSDVLAKVMYDSAWNVEFGCVLRDRFSVDRCT